ncbi:uncharacterized protein zgc:158432 [Ictalurus punctatus]|uniref:Uncharacterized protein zgc:158432 n=1 Tax=Ictalurus punctatus TaxID=7998 RepID=A0A9F7R7F0_ICTPU|nr:uncharacterized protein zgc:158432 [Ictalurus punctatus]
MWVFLCVCFVASFICSADGQGADTICTDRNDFDACADNWKCDLKVSQCFCKSGTPYCRCNNYIDEFYLGERCSQKWTTLSFALVATLPGVALAFVIGLAVHLAHRFGKSSKSPGAGNELTYIQEPDLFPGIVFASDLNTPPPPGPTPVKVGVPMVSSRPYSVSDNTQFLSGGPPMRAPPPQYSAPDNTRPAFDRPPLGARYSLPPSSGTLGVPERAGQQPYSYTGGGAQAVSNPYARARNPYEDHGASGEQYNQPPSPRAYAEMAPPPAPSYSAPERGSVFPRAQIGRPY